MDSISVHVGKKLKFFRKLKNLSLDELSAMIHKSKSTLSKYENGNISIDIETLLDIANALEVDLNLLIDYKVKKAETKLTKSPFGSHNQLYIYYYDGRKKSVIKSLLTLNNDLTKNGTECMFFMDIPSFDKYEKCQFFYIGELNSFDLVTYLTLTNQANPMERLGFCILNPFHYNTTTWGFMFGISYNPIAPFALKFLLSNKPLPDEEITFERLSITSNEIKIMKNLNMMLLNADK
jgi:Predicted transcriptional regulators